MSMATVTQLPPAGPFTMPHPKDEAWRYSDRAALEAVQSLPARTDAPARHVLADGARLEQHLAAPADSARHYRESIAIGNGDTATVIHHAGGAGWLDAAIDIDVEDARLHHIVIQDAADEAVITLAIKARLGAAAHYRLTVLHLGAKFGRVALDSVLDGQDARLDVAAVHLARGKRVVETVTRTGHAVPHTQSNQIVRNVLAARATANYLGKIVVEKGAQKTDAAQNARALLLDRTATANTKPELEIYADDVKCAHGAAIGALDEDALFYLMSRGVSAADARSMLIDAFIADALDTLADDAARALLQDKAAAWLAAEDGQ